MTISYKESGVDTLKAETILNRFSDFQKSRPKNPFLLSGIGPFASCFSLKEILSEMEDPLLVSCCDGVGTKSKLASDWEELSGLGQDLVAMNVNDLICVGARPLVFLDYYACGNLEEKQLLTLLKSIQNACELAGCSLAGGETAEMPGVYQNGDFDLGGFSVGIVDRKKTLGSEKVLVGDVIIAIESSGFHSNGYSLVRKIVESRGIKPNDRVPFGTQSWRETLLKPTLIYSQTLEPIYQKLHALAHITGEGITGNLPRVLPPRTQAVLELNKFELSPLFHWIQQEAKLSLMEMFGTFNCGWGMLAVTSLSDSVSVLDHLTKSGLRSQVVGEVKSSQAEEPSIEWKDS